MPKNYRPSEKEPFMNSRQRVYFREKLTRWRQELLNGSSETLHHLQDGGGAQEPDLADRASSETERSLELRTRDRERKLLKKVEQSIARIDAGDYGYCDETGEPIGVPRLIARPTANLTLEAQERREKRQKMHGD